MKKMVLQIVKLLVIHYYLASCYFMLWVLWRHITPP